MLSGGMSLQICRGVVRALGRFPLCRRTWKDGDDLVFHVYAFVVIMIQLGRCDSETNEDDGALRGGVGAEVIAGGDVVILEAKCLRSVASCDHHRAVRGLNDRLAERHALKKCAVIATRLESHGFKFAGDVLRGDLVSAGGGPAALE